MTDKQITALIALIDAKIALAMAQLTDDHRQRYADDVAQAEAALRESYR